MHLPWRLVALPLALAASLCTLWLMKVLIETRSIEEAFEQPPARIVFISNDLEDVDNPEPPSPSQPERQEQPEPAEKAPTEEQPTPPEPVEAPPPPPEIKEAKVRAPPPKKERPKQEPKPKATRKASAPSAAAQARFSSTPLYRPKPSYPMHARRNRTEGYVLVRYSIAKSGAVTNVGVISASPPGIFDSAALDAVRRWRYQPQPIDRPGMQTRISFVLRGR
ncbi:MAG: TonB family protein [Gammaproteobacteria bacterium]|nr:TonB family protein [Gammaproteobacteria bacterium]MBU1653702.1 TonB family protein [Gammaproteobacteria bacterium]MBU1962755.1 TonB family protein [Gammaproteobacteria bacterium]